MKTINAKSILILTAAATAVVAQAHCEPGSFLNKHAHNITQLVRQVEQDSEVRSRYERHFHMSESEIITYFEGLHVGKLRSTGDYVVYNCHDDGVIRARVFHLRAGTPMFVDRNDKPILKISCGNPMVAPTPKVVIVVKPKPHHHHHVVEVPAPTPCPPPPVVMAQPPCPTPPPPPPAPPVVSGPVSNSSVVNKSSSSLFLLPLVLVFNHSSHSSKVIVKKQPTPEPASLLIFGFGATSLLLRKRKKNSA